MSNTGKDFQNKKYMYDDNGQRLPVSQFMQIKTQLAEDEIKFCVGCVESVVKCAVEVEKNMTTVQTEGIFAQVESFTHQANKQLTDMLTMQAEIKEKKEELQRMKEDFDSYRKTKGTYVKAGFAFGGAIFGFLTGLLRTLF